MALQKVDIGGIVYTSVFNPVDERKNWRDMISAFCWAFAKTEDATLLLKLVHADNEAAAEPLLEHVYRMLPFECRVLTVQGYLPDADYATLVDLTSYYVNTAHGEGQCIPLLEFLCAGVPAIAPKATALAEYIDDDLAFVVDSSREPTSWQHDPRQAIRTTQNRLNWESLVAAYAASYRLIKSDPEGYRAMSRTAAARMQAFCSRDVAERKLRSFFGLRGVGDPPPCPAAEPAPAAPTTPSAPQSDRRTQPQRTKARVEEGPALARALDRSRAGWYDTESGVLVPGMKIEQDDVVLVVGCRDPEPVVFAAARGARVIFTDAAARPVRQLAERLGAAQSQRLEGLVSSPACISVDSGIATKIVCIETLDRDDEPALILRELVRIGAPDSQYLVGTASQCTRAIATGESRDDDSGATRGIEGREIEALIESVGLRIDESAMVGFYDVVARSLAAAAGADAPPGADPGELEGLAERRMPRPTPVQQSWARTWRMLLALPEARSVQRALNSLLPDQRLYLARKPSG